MNVVKEMTVEGAGRREINGTYQRCGEHDGVSKYIKPSSFDGQSVDFLLFRCKLTDGTSRWYISFVPKNTHPGICVVYAARLSPGSAEVDHSHSIPPRDGWIAIPSNGGASPAPTVYPPAMESTEDVTFIGVKQPEDIVRERVEAAEAKGSIIAIDDVDDDDDDDDGIKTTYRTENTTGRSPPKGSLMLMPVVSNEYVEGEGNEFEAKKSSEQLLTQMWLLTAREFCEECKEAHHPLFKCSSCRKCFHGSCLERWYNIYKDDTEEDKDFLMCPSCKNIQRNTEDCDGESDYCEDE